MKYYLYVSNTKVDMLYAQIPIRLRDKIATELTIDLKVFSTKFSDLPPEVTLFSKLDVVAKYIEKHEPVGTVDEPAKFFKGNMPMRWVPGLGLKGAGISPIVYFGGATQHTVLGLGGSRKHIIGEAIDTRDEIKGYYNSSTVAFLIRELFTKDEKPKDRMNYLSDEVNDDQYVLGTVAATTRAMTGTLQKMDFLAKRLSEGYEAGVHVLLGTPIYVALAD